MVHPTRRNLNITLIPLLLLLLLLLIDQADGHGFMCVPGFRGALRTGNSMHVPKHDDLDDIEVDHCPHCLNGGGKGSVMLAAGAAGWRPWDPLNTKVPFRRDSGMCGDAIKDPAPRKHEIGGMYGRSKKMPFSAVYQQGEVIKMVADITTNHNGFFQFFICDVSKCGGDINEKCFKGGHCKELHRVKVPECESQKSKECGPLDPKYPGRWYVPCRKGGHTGEHFMGGKFMQYKLPAGFYCEHCVIQWYWATANSCNPPGFAEYFEQFPMPGWGKCPGDGGAVGGRNPTAAKCGGETFPEEFWMCADVRVTGSGVPKPSIMPRPGTGAKLPGFLGLGTTTPTHVEEDDDDDHHEQELHTKKAAHQPPPSTATQTPPPKPHQQEHTMHEKKMEYTAPPSVPKPQDNHETAHNAAVAAVMPAEHSNTHAMGHAEKKPADTHSITLEEEKPAHKHEHSHAKAKLVEQKEYVPKPVDGAATANKCTEEPVSDKPVPNAKCAKKWGQCGGKQSDGKPWTGPTECCDPKLVCHAANAWYAQCRPPPAA